MRPDLKKEDKENRAKGLKGLCQRGWRLMHDGGSAGWLITTILQALLTWGFIGISKLAEGFPWEPQAKMLVLVAIVATWCMALRTIRARLLELIRFWRKGSQVLLNKARENAEERPGFGLKSFHKVYVRKSMFRLRIIAAGLTMPFFVLPIFTASLCVALCWYNGRGDFEMLGMALVLSVLGAVVGAYFHWTVMPAPARYPVRAGRPVSERMRRRG
jgi:hypothetical protein